MLLSPGDENQLNFSFAMAQIHCCLLAIEFDSIRLSSIQSYNLFVGSCHHHIATYPETMKLAVSLAAAAAFMLPSVVHGSTVPQRRTGIFCIGTSLALEDGPNVDAPTLGPNEWLCDPSNVSTRFGMSSIGFVQQYVNGKLVWQASERGARLGLQPEKTNLGLYAGDGTKKWSTSCTAVSMGGSLVLTRGGNVMLSNSNGELVWVLNSNGKETQHKCTAKVGVDNYASEMHEGEENAIVHVEDQIGTVDITQHRCVGSSIAAGKNLLPTEYICDEQNSGNRFGLSYFGLPTFYRNDVLIWWQDVTADRLRLREDGNLLLESKGYNADVKWSSNCFDKEEVGSDSFVGGNTLEFIDGEVWVYNEDAVLVWGLDAAGDESKCFPYGKTQTLNRANPFLCAGKAISPDRHLEPHEFICDPLDNGNRFGLSANGFVELYEGHELMWRSENTGNQLYFSYDDAELILREEGETKWTSGCTSDAVGKKVKYTPSGVKVIDRSGNLVWAMTHDGFPSQCFPEGRARDDDDVDDDDEVVAPDNCKGFSLKVGEIMKPNEFLCDPNDPTIRFGLSFVGMPQLLRGEELLWFVPARGEKLVYHDDGHLVLYGEGQVKWSTRCYGKSRGRQIDFMQGSVNVLDEDWALIWKLDADGSSSECYPGFVAGSASGGNISGI